MTRQFLSQKEYIIVEDFAINGSPHYEICLRGKTWNLEVLMVVASIHPDPMDVMWSEDIASLVGQDTASLTLCLGSRRKQQKATQKSEMKRLTVVS